LIQYLQALSEAGLDDAATKIGALAAKACPATSPERVFKALAIIEALRAELTMDLGK
jgi:flagellin-specific chaperone FliS